MNTTHASLMFRRSSPTPFLAILSAVAISVICGCREAERPLNPEPSVDPPVEFAPALPIEQTLTADKLRTLLAEVNDGFDWEKLQLARENGELKVAAAKAGLRDISPLRGLPIAALDLAGNAISDLSPLAGMPLQELYLEQTDATDIAPLAGMPLKTLYISQTKIADLSPLAGAPLTELNAVETLVADLAPLRGAPLKMVWLSDCPVVAVEPLVESPLVSLTLHNTQVTDLSPLGQIDSLQRLHIAGIPATDLRPLKGLKLQRLIFSPDQIEHGLDVVREMSSLRELDTELREPQPMTPAKFWATQSPGNAASQGD